MLNSEGLRYDNEFVRTRCWTRSATSTCSGHPLIGQYTAFKSGHALNNALARALLARPDAFEIVTFTDEATCRPRSRTGPFSPRDPCPVAAVPGAGRDRRRRRSLFSFKQGPALPAFIAQVVKFTIFLLAGILLFFAFERHAPGPSVAPCGQDVSTAALSAPSGQVFRQTPQRRGVDLFPLNFKIFIGGGRSAPNLHAHPYFSKVAAFPPKRREDVRRALADHGGDRPAACGQSSAGCPRLPQRGPVRRAGGVGGGGRQT